MRDRVLQGQTAIVTGGASGMGRAIASLFHDQGASVVVADLNHEAASALAKTLGEGALACQVDVADEVSVSHLVQVTVEHFGAVDVLVNCAGIAQTFTPIEELELTRWERILNVNCRSVFLATKYAVPHMKRKGGGTIVNIASILGVRAKSGLNAYCASKAAVISLGQSLALELAPFKIRVNSIGPGAAETPMLGKFVNENADLEAKDKQAFADNIPLGMLIQPQDVAEAALYLASSLSRQVTGHVMIIDGGRSL